MLGLANVETWDNIVKKFRMRIPERCADKSKGKRKSNGIIKPMICIEKFLIEDADGTNHAEDADGTNHSDLKTRLKRKKEADDKIKEGTLNLDDGTDAMTIVFGKKKGGYARVVGSRVTNKRYFHLPRSRQATNERIELLQSQLDNERRERQQKGVLVKKLSTEMTEKDVLVKKLSNEMTKTKGMLSQLMNQLAAQGVQLNLSSQLQVALDVTPIGAYEVDGTQSSVVVRDKYARIKKKSNGLVTSRKRNQDVLDEEVTPPTTITQRFSDYNSAPKLQSKRKNYVSRETMQRQARTGKSHKSLNYGS
ncbi:hypothetical protein Tco_0250991 [Tanacetum coccineum]